MTAREIDLLREYLGREMQLLRGDVRELREEAAEDHRLVRAEIQDVAHRVSLIENEDQKAEGREQFKREMRGALVRGALTAQAALVGVGGLVLTVLQQFN